MNCHSLFDEHSSSLTEWIAKLATLRAMHPSLTIRGHLVRVGGDHSVHVHLLSDVRLLIHKDYSSLLPRTRPRELVVIGA